MGAEITQDIDAIRGYLKKADTKLISEMLNNMDVFSDLSAGVMRNLLVPKDLNKMTVDAGVRPLNTTIEAEKGKRVWTKRTITPRFGMKIMHVIPEELRETFMSELLAPGAKREPFAAWALAREFEKIGQEINDNFYLSDYKADAADWIAATAYSTNDVVFFTTDDIFYKANQAAAADESPATDPAKWDDVDNQVMYDGPGTLIADEITAANLTAIATGSYDNLTAYEAYKTMWDAIPDAKKSAGLYAYASFGSVEDLIEDHNKTFGSGAGVGGVDLDTNKPFVLKGTTKRLTVYPASWMGSSRRIVMVKPGNIRVGTNRERELNNSSKLIETLHGYKSVVKWQLTSQIADLEAIFVNDQA